MIRVRQFLHHPAGGAALAVLAPALLLSLGALFGGFWALLGLLSMTLFLAAADRIARRLGTRCPEAAEDIWTQRLTVTIAVLHFPVLALAVFALSGGTGLGWFGWACTFLGFGLWFGQVSNATAHELIHKTWRPFFWLGMWVYISLLYGHHTSAHRLVHHRFVATPDDPNTAELGESFYAFAARAWPGAFLAGYEMETARFQSLDEGGGRGFGLHPYTVYLAGGALVILLIAAAFGFLGVLAYLAVCAHAQVQLLLSDYVQHYGLQRRRLALDKYEAAGPEHSWDAPDFVSGLMMLNAPRHADHHAHPGRPWPELVLSPEGRAPLLPYSLPVMATVALIPPVWQRLMDPRVRNGTGPARRPA